MEVTLISTHFLKRKLNSIHWHQHWCQSVSWQLKLLQLLKSCHWWTEVFSPCAVKAWGLFSLRNEGLSYLFDLSSIGYHYVNICKLKCNWKHCFVPMSKPTVCSVASLVARFLPHAKLRRRLCVGITFPAHDEAVLLLGAASNTQRASAVNWRQHFTAPEPEGNIRLRERLSRLGHVLSVWLEVFVDWIWRAFPILPSLLGFESWCFDKLNRHGDVQDVTGAPMTSPGITPPPPVDGSKNWKSK